MRNTPRLDAIEEYIRNNPGCNGIEAYRGGGGSQNTTVKSFMYDKIYELIKRGRIEDRNQKSGKMQLYVIEQ